MIWHLIHPLVLMRMGPKPSGSRLIPLHTPDDIARLPEVLRDALTGAEQSLARRGFAPPLRAVNKVSEHFESCVSLVEHPAEHALGFIMIVKAKTGRANIMATFTTEFSDDWTVMTSNSTSVLRTPSRPKVDAVRLKAVHDIGDLYDIHRRRVAERSKTKAAVRGTRGNDPIGYQDREARQVQDFWIEKGYYRRVDGDRIQLTPLGATLSAWRGLFPWKQITESAKDKKERDVLARFGAA